MKQHLVKCIWQWIVLLWVSSEHGYVTLAQNDSPSSLRMSNPAFSAYLNCILPHLKHKCRSATFSRIADRNLLNQIHSVQSRQRTSSGAYLQNLESRPVQDSAHWKTWYQNQYNQEDTDLIFNPKNLRNNSAGYETDEYCIYDLRMSYINGSPDGVQKRIIGFNGQFPGPTLRCTKGKTMIVRVTNDIQDDDEPTSIHWHGIQQNLSPFYDGPQSITQCPVIRSNSMIYKFPVFQSGTYWYHSHHSYQYVDGAWGFLIIKNTPKECWANSYDDERLISINDWIHRPAKNVSEVFLTQNIFPLSNSSLINGRGTFNCSRVETGQICDPSLQGPSVINVIQGKRYRFRILNSSGAQAYNFSIDGHKMVVIETDGVDTVKSPKVDVVPILAAQRYSVIVIMDRPVGQYWIRTAGDIGSGPVTQGRAILQYELDPDPIQPALEPTETDPGVEQGRRDYHDIPWEDFIKSGGIKVPTREELQKYFPYPPPKINFQLQAEIEAKELRIANQTPKPTSLAVNSTVAVLLDEQSCPPLQFGMSGNAPRIVNRLITMNVTDCPIPGEAGRLCMNAEPFIPGSMFSPPVLYQVIRGTKIQSSVRPIYTPKQNQVIWIVINNRHDHNHPWHLHGHTFWVLGRGALGAGDFVLSRDISKLTTAGARRDTTLSLANSWVVVAYITDNPGAWFFHCHINWHLEAGLAMTFIESRDIAKEVYKFPPLESVRTCAKVGVTI